METQKDVHSLSSRTITPLISVLKKADLRLGLVRKRGQVMRPILGLQDFLLRARVLKLYRQSLRTARRAPLHARAELKRIMRQEMENNRTCNDKQRIRYLISDGLGRLKQLSETLDMQGHC